MLPVEIVLTVNFLKPEWGNAMQKLLLSVGVAGIVATYRNRKKIGEWFNVPEPIRNVKKRKPCPHCDRRHRTVETAKKCHDHYVNEKTDCTVETERKFNRWVRQLNSQFGFTRPVTKRGERPKKPRGYHRAKPQRFSCMRSKFHRARHTAKIPFDAVRDRMKKINDGWPLVLSWRALFN